MKTSGTPSANWWAWPLAFVSSFYFSTCFRCERCTVSLSVAERKEGGDLGQNKTHDGFYHSSLFVISFCLAKLVSRLFVTSTRLSELTKIAASSPSDVAIAMEKEGGSRQVRFSCNLGSVPFLSFAVVGRHSLFSRRLLGLFFFFPFCMRLGLSVGTAHHKQG